jgi:nitrogen fixation protein NifX
VKVLSSRKLSLVTPTTTATNNIRIAFATSDNEHVNQHFGSSIQFAIYELCGQRWQLIELIKFQSSPQGHDENKLQLRIKALDKCSAIYCNAIGSSAISQLLSLKIKPVNVVIDLKIKTILHELIQASQRNSKYWLSKMHQDFSIKQAEQAGMQGQTKQRLASLLNEHWD